MGCRLKMIKRGIYFCAFAGNGLFKRTSLLTLTAPPSYIHHKQIASKPVVKKSKQKIALVLGYCGKNYSGMQIQRPPDSKTIEDKFFSALLKSNVITQKEYESPWLIEYQRASRTDKRVSAIKQIVSFKIGFPPKSDFVMEVNKHLPPEIRVFGFKVTPKKFDCKNDCSSRTYSYMLPTFAFTPLEELTTEHYRISDSLLEKVNKTLQMFKGSHKFHNFTIKISHEDPSCKRKMIYLKCERPFIREGIEFTIINIKGHSFMMHQIRKMIGLTIAIVRGIVPPDVVNKCWELEHVDVPKAPGNGLFLDEVHFDWYNKTFAGTGQYEQLLWDEYKVAINELKEKYIVSSIVKVEVTEKSMLRWLNSLLFYVYDDYSEEHKKSWLGDLTRYLKEIW